MRPQSKGLKEGAEADQEEGMRVEHVGPTHPRFRFRVIADK